ncbi:hypothetical protein QLX52_30535 [Streptomyces albus]|uniref:hypothetical protein n=1 Tax=Streptomyces albus TaxID=1888 RepID=UPI0024AD0986|nr:hypothetical protein [Streptomyces albus]MDI6413147.1 hypothetical protein [Streptomyces albus]
MTVQPDHTAPNSGPVPAIPHTTNAIGDALDGADRALFYSRVLAADETSVPAVMRRWWKTAMLNRAPHAETSRTNAARGQHLVSVDDLAACIEEADAP